MKLTKRGRRVAVIAYLLALVGLWYGVHELNIHTKITTCQNEAEGWTCQTAWR